MRRWSAAAGRPEAVSAVAGRSAAVSAAAGRPEAVSAAAGRALSPFSWPFHHLPWNKTGQKPLLLTGTGERARKVVKGPPGHPGRADLHRPARRAGWGQ